MPQITLSILFAAGLFAGVIVALRLGWVLGRKRLLALGQEGTAGLGAVEGAVFGLMGLLLAFTFTGAASRFDHRRNLITQQANAIGTAYLRLDLLEPASRDELRGLLREYVDLVLEVSRHAARADRTAEFLQRRSAIEGQIWEKVVGAIRAENVRPLAPVLLPPINEMFDLATSRILATRQHPPPAVYAMLGSLILVSGLLAGFGMANSLRQSRLHVVGFAAITALSVYLILDFEYPRLGLIRVDGFDRALIELRQSME